MLCIREARKLLPGISRATVYRAVTKLLEEGKHPADCAALGERIAADAGDERETAHLLRDMPYGAAAGRR